MSMSQLPRIGPRNVPSNVPGVARRGAAATLLALSLGALAACGGGDSGGDSGGESGGGAEEQTSEAEEFADSSVQEIADAAIKDTTAVTSLTMSGSLSSGGQDISLDLALDKDGQCAGTVGIGGGEAEIVALTENAYLRGDEKFWASAAGGEEAAKAMLQMVGDKWIKVPGDQNQFGQFCDLDTLLENFEDISGSSTDEVEKGDITDINGTDAITLVDTSDPEEKTTGYVAVEAPHYLLRIEADGEEAGTIDFSGFDEPVDVKEPAEADVVDLGALGGASG